jgi:hypothetical protein
VREKLFKMERIVLETDFLNKIPNKNCDLCKKNKSYSGMISSHIHPGIESDKIYFGKVLMNGSVNNELVENVYYIYICSKCVDINKNDMTYRICLLCSRLKNCPKCKNIFSIIKDDNNVKECSKCKISYTINRVPSNEIL